MNVAYIVTNSGTISLMYGNKPYTITTDHHYYKQILEQLRQKNYTNLENLLDVGNGIVQQANISGGNNRIEFKNGLLYFDGFIIDNSLTRRILQLVQENYPFEPMIKFLENIMKNPSARAIQELYTFLEVNNIPITEDGCFLAYKRVRDDYKDMYSGTFDNSIGKEVIMERTSVTDDKNQTCAAGLHVAAFSYIPHYNNGEGRVMIVKVDPADVVSIPVDYKSAKMRVCRYIVIAEIPDAKTDLQEVFDQPLYGAKGEQFVPSTSPTSSEIDNGLDEDEDIEDIEDEDIEDIEDIEDEDEDENVEDKVIIKKNVSTPQRDKSGRFLPKLGKKPDGTNFWNKRDINGRFIKKS